MPEFVSYQSLSTIINEPALASFKSNMLSRRSIREFSNAEVDEKTIQDIITIAASAPSGANKQPWHFVAVKSADLKSKIREAAENEEKINYSGRMSDEWLKDLAQFGTTWEKPFIDIAPWIIIVFKKSYDIDIEGNKSKNYYVNESVGIACGFLIAAIHMAGLVTLTHTPSPMNFLQNILERPENEKPYLLLPVGYPAVDAMVPNILKKDLDQTLTIF
jgi:iodotyrosine deiodinase